MTNQRLAASFALIATCVLVTACDKPGVGRNYEAARQEAEPVVAAIESWRREHDAYPRTLDALVPVYLDAKVLQDHNAGNAISFIYVSNAPNAYTFVFGYTGPGRNSCAHDQTDVQGQWTCSGHY